MKNKFIILLFVMFIYCQKNPIDKATNTIKKNIELKGEGMLNGLKNPVNSDGRFHNIQS